mgnify:CR=1 FL=1
MNFNIKMDDKKIKVNIENSTLKDVLKYCKPKEQLVLLKKFGILTGKEVPLQRIGKEYNLTRERVRQIETQALMRFRRLIVGNSTYLKVIEEAKKILDTHGGILLEDQLIAKLINKQIFSFSSKEIKLILVSDFDIAYLKRNKLINKSFYKDPLFEDLLTSMVLYVKDYFEKKWWSEDLYEFIDKIKSHFSSKYENIEYLKNISFYTNFFNTVRGIKVFDGKIGLATFTDVYPKTIKLKIIYTLRRMNKPMHFQELATKIIERFPTKAVKVNTVHNELVKNNSIFVNMGLGLYGLKERGYQGWIVQEIIVRILKKAGRPMSVKEISKELLKEKMVSPNTVILNLQKYKDHFERLEKGIYGLKEKTHPKRQSK